MTMRWLECGHGSLHIIGPCPECYVTQGGLLIGTVANNHTGRVPTLCPDCNNTVDYYTDANEAKLWKLEQIEAKGSRIANISN